MRPTIYTVAQRAGVSTATVSRVLNNSPQVKDETRAKVLNALEELGYQPSASARGLALSSTETIALIFPQVSGPFFSEIIQGAEAEAHQHHYHLLIYGVHDREGSDQLLRFLSSKVDGLILTTSWVNQRYVKGLMQQRVPFVLLGQEMDGVVADCIRPSNRNGAYQVVTHLIQHHGYQRIAFVGSSQNMAHSRARYRGYCQALQAASLQKDASLIAHGEFDEASGYRAMTQLLDLAAPPQAVFFANDQMAIGALAAARERQVRVPDDIAIAGFDDIEAAAYAQPPLTTVRQAIRKQGELAVQLLLQRMAHPDARAETLVLPTELVIRRSCGCSV